MLTGVTLQGAIFVQCGTVGMASYHFGNRDVCAGCYISYENAPTHWVLDDGGVPPLRKPFENAKYEEATRTFRGTVTWEPVGFGGVRWEYCIVFNRALDAIVDGTCIGFDERGAMTWTCVFSQSHAVHGDDETHDLVYVRHTRRREVLREMRKSIAFKL